MLKIYTHVSEEDKLNAVQVISAYCNATATETPEDTDS